MPYVVHMSLLEGHVSPSECFKEGQSAELAAVTAERWYMAPGIRRIEIRQNGVVGTLFLPPGKHTLEDLQNQIHHHQNITNCTDSLQVLAHSQPCWICGG